MIINCVNFSIFSLFLFIIINCIILNFIYKYFTKFNKIVIINDKYQYDIDYSILNDAILYMKFDNDNNVYKMQDHELVIRSIKEELFDHKLKCTNYGNKDKIYYYKIEGYGFRFKLLNMYHNVINIKFYPNENKYKV